MKKTADQSVQKLLGHGQTSNDNLIKSYKSPKEGFANLAILNIPEPANRSTEVVSAKQRPISAHPLQNAV